MLLGNYLPLAGAARAGQTKLKEAASEIPTLRPQDLCSTARCSISGVWLFSYGGSCVAEL